MQQNWESAYYINNNLPKTLNYESSSLEVKQVSINKLKEDKWKKSYSYRKKNWVLDYRSEIVLPLIPSKNQEEYFILGFLCIDCAKEDTHNFNESFDVPLLKGVIDGIYDLIWSNFDFFYKKY